MTKLTTQQIADLLGVEVWRIQRLYELGLLQEPEWFGGKRVIPGDQIPEIVDALRARGWLVADGSQNATAQLDNAGGVR